MRILNLDGRAALAIEDKAVDLESASDGRFSADIQEIYVRWDEFRSWAAGFTGAPDREVVSSALGAPVPRPPQVFAIGVNYRDHAAEAGIDLPEHPMVFTKFPAAVTGPFNDIVLPSDYVDFEVELVAVIGRHARQIPESEGWSYIAGLTAGQDLSERAVQLAGPPPQQYNMGKSFEGFAPIGPVLATPDEFDNPDDIELRCTLDGEQMQHSRTGDFVFTIPQLVASLSSVLPLLPGDLIFTGTPAGVGWVRNPRRTIATGEELVTHISGIGEMRHRFVSQADTV